MKKSTCVLCLCIDLWVFASNNFIIQRSNLHAMLIHSFWNKVHFETRQGKFLGINWEPLFISMEQVVILFLSAVISLFYKIQYLWDSWPLMVLYETSRFPEGRKRFIHICNLGDLMVVVHGNVIGNENFCNAQARTLATTREPRILWTTIY